MKKTIKLIGSAVIAFLIVNFIFAFYSTDAGWLKRSGGPTAGVYIPGHYIINMEEGAGVRQADANGYLNQSSELENGYILVLGKSHTNAIEVSDKYRYVSLLNDYICGNENKNKVYSVARGGNTFADLIGGFDALIHEFDDSSCVILEMDSVGQLEDLENAIENQRTWTENDSADYLVKNQSIGDFSKTFIKEKMPLLAYLVNERIPKLDLGMNGAFFYESSNLETESQDELEDRNQYYRVLSNAMELIRSEYGNRIIILYHPSVSISEDGDLVTNEMLYLNELKLACQENGIEFCDMTEAFQEEYKKNYFVPYGFMNTSMGEGHLNKHGHKIIAEYLYKQYFAEVEKK